jgi:hypothetical protein
MVPAAASISEIDVWLRDMIRGKSIYSRLKTLVVSPTTTNSCGWLAQVQGDFTVEDEAVVADAIRQMQDRFYRRET